MSNFSIKQGQSYTFSGELTDSKGNPIELSKFDKIRALVSSQWRKVILGSESLSIKENKLIFKISADDTRTFQGRVVIEVELRKGETVVIGTTKEIINVEPTKISKL